MPKLKLPKKNKQKRANEPPGTRVPFRFRKHLLPPLGGLLVFILVFGFFNSQWISGQIAYRLKQRSDSANTVIIPTTTKKETDNTIRIDKTAAPVIDIPNLNVHAPVNYTLATNNEKDFQIALRDGVVQYPGTAKPGQAGNIVIFGHSSGQWWAKGNYKFIFSLLEKIEEGNQISLDYDGIRYVYKVTGKRIVAPTDVSVLNADKSHKLTLLTCAPVGSNTKRLVVEAIQISPNTTDADQNPPSEVRASLSQKLPAGAPSFWDTFTGLFR